MKLEEKISLEEVFGKAYKIRLIEPENNKEAVITHFLNNNKKGVSKAYKNDAIKFTKEILQYKFPDENITNVLAEEALQYGIFETFDIPFPAVKNPKFKFIDLFAGVGGFRLAMQNLSGKCVYSSEWSLSSQNTYSRNFGEIPFGDINKDNIKIN